MVNMNDNIVITNEEFLQPHYSISPFTTSYLSTNIQLPESDKCMKYLNTRFGENKYCFEENGRKAISHALSLLELNEYDIVTVLTTSGNFYVSGCVTKEIEKFCKWSRSIEERTKVIFVIHEFGFPYENLNNLKKYNLPIIEDCAHSFISQNTEKSVGTVGDFTIFSLPKIFPVQFGGLLVSKNKSGLKPSVSNEEQFYLERVLSDTIENLSEVIEKRISNHKYLVKKIAELRLYPRFELNETIHCPGVFMFKIGQDYDLNELKKFMQFHGVESSVFYKEQSFYIPLHQNLSHADLDYFYLLLKEFIRESESYER
ncbi:hypothetical protein FACS1894125_1310 [Actinomycetota bacterium]|nr:hypothetical protein FACS1894125_1310 [Actinomycetota bacterium]